PPLTERIRALDPSFDGQYPSVIEKPKDTARPTEGAVQRLRAIPFIPAAVLATVGQPAPKHLQYATEFKDTIPASVESALRDPLGASALICAFLLSNELSVREK